MNIINNSETLNIDAKYILKIDNKVIYEYQGMFMSFYEDIPSYFTIADKSQDEFRKNTPDFENKDFYYYNFKIWPMISLEPKEIDYSFYKC
ncbi:MAG: hypothetical protein HUJ68_10865 [Clostridia bacterium]|nr:hypothetical protein [Clostridia bacterium]